jgi:hypothetical protein
MLGASRFEGGSWVRVGFLVTYAAFAYGCVVIGAAALRLPSFWRPNGPDVGAGDARTRRGAAAASAGAAVAAIGALAMPAIRFPAETLSGFEGLDLLSVIIVVALGVVVAIAAVNRTFDSLRLPATACLEGVLAGNLLIQRYITRGTAVEYGLWWSTAAAALSVAAALGVRGRPEERR